MDFGSAGLWILIILITTMVTMIYNRRYAERGYNIYTHKRGKTYSLKDNNPISFKFGFAPKMLKFSVVFSDGCNYNRTLLNSVNCLYGMSFGFDSLWRSVTIGWRYNSNLKVIELFGVAIIQGKRYVKKLINVKQYQMIDCIISYDENKKSVIIVAVDDDHKAEQEIKGVEWSFFNLLQFPRLSFPAPQNMKIFIR